MDRRWTPLIALIVAITGCSVKKHLTADEYFEAANADFRSGALSLSIQEFHDLLDQYPFSQYNEEAELKIAHAHYLEGEYMEAVVALTDFQRRHPTSPNLPFVGYYLGMCYVRQMNTIDRDQTAAQNAQAYFLTVSRQYPDSPFAELAQEELGHCRETLAEHELYIAKFYERNGNSKATEIRLLTMASSYGETDAAAEGLLGLATLYRQSQRPADAVLAYQALTRLHPNGSQAAAARQGLDQLADVDPPTTSDPLDVLLAANGRRRSTGTFEIVQVPGLEPVHTAKRPTGVAGPGMVPSLDPFGRGRPY